MGTHVVGGVLNAQPGLVVVQDAGLGRFMWYAWECGAQYYEHYDYSGGGTSITDAYDYSEDCAMEGGSDWLNLFTGQGSPSQPPDPQVLVISRVAAGDDPFIDVQVFLP